MADEQPTADSGCLETLELLLATAILAFALLTAMRYRDWYVPLIGNAAQAVANYARMR